MLKCTGMISQAEAPTLAVGWSVAQSPSGKLADVITGAFKHPAVTIES